MAVFNIMSFSTCLRPSSGITRRTLDLVPLPPGGGTAAVQHWTLLAAPNERETATKTGDYDMAVVLDDTREPRLGKMLHRQCLAQLARAGAKPEEDEVQVPMWEFSSRQLVEVWKESVQAI